MYFFFFFVIYTIVPSHGRLGAIQKKEKTCLFWGVLDVVALQLGELVKAEPAEGYTSARILPAGPCEVLFYKLADAKDSVQRWKKGSTLD